MQFSLLDFPLRIGTDYIFKMKGKHSGDAGVQKIRVSISIPFHYIWIRPNDESEAGGKE